MARIGKSWPTLGKIRPTLAITWPTLPEVWPSSLQMPPKLAKTWPNMSHIRKMWLISGKYWSKLAKSWRHMLANGDRIRAFSGATLRSTTPELAASTWGMQLPGRVARNFAVAVYSPPQPAFARPSTSQDYKHASWQPTRTLGAESSDECDRSPCGRRLAAGAPEGEVGLPEDDEAARELPLRVRWRGPAIPHQSTWRRLRHLISMAPERRSLSFARLASLATRPLVRTQRIPKPNPSTRTPKGIGARC